MSKTAISDKTLKIVDHSSVFSAFSTIRTFLTKSGFSPEVRKLANSETGKRGERLLPGSWPLFLTKAEINVPRAEVLTNSETGIKKEKGRLRAQGEPLSDINLSLRLCAETSTLP